MRFENIGCLFHIFESFIELIQFFFEQSDIKIGVGEVEVVVISEVLLLDVQTLRVHLQSCSQTALICIYISNTHIVAGEVDMV